MGESNRQNRDVTLTASFTAQVFELAHRRPGTADPHDATLWDSVDEHYADPKSLRKKREREPSVHRIVAFRTVHSVPHEIEKPSSVSVSFPTS